MKDMLLSKLKITTALMLAFGLCVGAGAWMLETPALAVAQGSPQASKAAPVQQPNAAATKRFPVFTHSKAFVQRDGEDRLSLRAELPMGRFLKLHDANGAAVHVHEFSNFQPPAFTVGLRDVQVYDTRGRAREQKSWLQELTGETLVLLEFAHEGTFNTKHFAEAFRLYREDVTVLVLPASTLDKVDKSKAFSAVISLPQVFPGSSPVPGAPIPPKKPDQE